MEIKSKILGKTITFDCQGRYIFVDLNGQKGSLGNQICYGGALAGSTITLSKDDDFEKVCKNWYRAYIKKNRDFI